MLDNDCYRRDNDRFYINALCSGNVGMMNIPIERKWHISANIFDHVYTDMCGRPDAINILTFLQNSGCPSPTYIASHVLDYCDASEIEHLLDNGLAISLEDLLNARYISDNVREYFTTNYTLTRK